MYILINRTLYMSCQTGPGFEPRTVRSEGERSLQLDVFVLVQSLFLAGIQKSTTVRIITCTDSKSTPCIILNIVYNLLNNIVYYIYIYFLYLINNHRVLLYVGFYMG